MTIVVHGMHGLGDNLHQRAVIRELLRQDDDIWLESSWVSVYHDLLDRGLKIVRKHTHLRTQAKNAERERAQFFPELPPATVPSRSIRMAYNSDGVRNAGSVLGAMLAALRLDPECADFRLPIPPQWFQRLPLALAEIDRPLLIYRPLVMRTEWNGSARNPDPAHYARLFRAVRSRFFVISVADLMPGKEWIEGEAIKADLELHHGELEFEALAALFASAALIYASPGFAIPLAQAVGSPVICIFGGYENSSSFAAGARFSPYLGIDTISPCSCFSSRCAGPSQDKRYARFFPNRKYCTKQIDETRALAAIEEFLAGITADAKIGASYIADQLARIAA